MSCNPTNSDFLDYDEYYKSKETVLSVIHWTWRDSIYMSRIDLAHVNNMIFT